jgi:integrase
MKIEVFVSNPMFDALSSQAETETNGALDMALQKALPFTEAARSDGTRRVYTEALQKWMEWASQHHTDTTGAAPTAVATYLANLARDGKSISSINVALSAIQRHGRAHGTIIDRKHPLIADVLRGINRTLSKPVDRAAALDLKTLRRLIATLNGNDNRSLRDKALILVGFFGALRRSEIVSLEMGGARSTVIISDRGLLLKLSATKASLKTQEIAIPRRSDDLCPVAAVERYLSRAVISSGPLFRAISKAGRLLDRPLDPTSVRHILARRTREAGLDACYSPHSLRSGFITSAARANVPEHLIQRTSRHKSVDVLRSYIRIADAFAENAAVHL